jgi:hypothetical protein
VWSRPCGEFESAFALVCDIPNQALANRSIADEDGPKVSDKFMNIFLVVQETQDRVSPLKMPRGHFIMPSNPYVRKEFRCIAGFHLSTLGNNPPHSGISL